MKQKLHIYFSPENAKWLDKMDSQNISRSSLVNLAIDMLKPKLCNHGATELSIKDTIASSRLKNILHEQQFDF